MACIKTGCHLWLESYGEYAYGDAFQFQDVFVFRIVARSFGPINKFHVKHFTVEHITHWFDEHERTSTLIATHCVNHGYEGAPI
jgi:hypothetical protein